MPCRREAAEAACEGEEEGQQHQGRVASGQRLCGHLRQGQERHRSIMPIIRMERTMASAVKRVTAVLTKATGSPRVRAKSSSKLTATMRLRKSVREGGEGGKEDQQGGVVGGRHGERRVAEEE